LNIETTIENAEILSQLHSEIIAKEIIEKLISFTITETYKLEIEKKLNSYTFNYLKNTFHHLLEINYITRERDDNDLNKTQTIEDDLFMPQSRYYYSNSYFGVNDWSEISEPVLID
jgi:hypothetical protein